MQEVQQVSWRVGQKVPQGLQEAVLQKGHREGEGRLQGLPEEEDLNSFAAKWRS